jgi:hypothetical protein
MDGIILKNVTVRGGHVEYHFHVTGILQQYFTTDTLFLDYIEDVTNVPISILVAPFVASIIPLMWATNTVMWVEEIDQTFYNSIHRVQEAYQRLYSHYPLKGNLIAARFTENCLNVRKDAMLLFSGGLDANCSYVRIHDKKPLLLNIQGWYKKLSDTDIAADADIRDIGAFAKREGIDFTYAKSNFAVLVREDLWTKNIRPKFGDSWWHGFQHSMAFITIAMPLAYKHGIQHIYIASSVPMGEFCMCASHVTTDSEFRYAGVGRCIHDGSELARQDKVRVVVGYQRQSNKPYPMRVCSFNDKNCCECEKCFRTVLGLVGEAADVNDFGFYTDKPLKEHWEDVMYRRAGLMSFKSERVLHWPYIIPRMKANYDKMTAEQQEFVDWFLSFDFVKAKREGLLRYYRKNFFSILKRKLKL